MNTVTLIAHDRPMHVARAIEALSNSIISYGEQFFDTLIFSIDPGCTEVVTLCDKAADVLCESGLISCAMYVNDQKYGVAGNTLLALHRAFEEQESEFNMSIEDDALLTEDAVRLAKWFADEHCDQYSRYTLFSMCNHRLYGRGHNPAGIPDDPALMSESLLITSPFAWCLSKHQWPFVQDTWDRKVLPPNGWDFSLSFSMRLAGRRTLHPILSRCKNIGETGVHTTKEEFEKTQTGLVYSDGTYVGPYQTVVWVPDSELKKPDPWMMSELKKIKDENKT